MLLDLDMPHVDVRVYAVFRSLATRWRNDRRLTKDQIRWLVPGVNGKPLGRSALYDSLKRLADHGLVTIERGSANVRRVRNAGGRFETVEELLWRVTELPIEGEDYAGPRSVFDALDAYPGPGWTAEQRQELARGELADDHVRISGRGNTWSDQPKRNVSAGDTGSSRVRKSGSAVRKSGSAVRKSGRKNAVTSGNTGPHTVLSNDLPNSSPQPPAAEQHAAHDGPGPKEGEAAETGNRQEPSADAFAVVDAAPWQAGQRPTTVQRVRLAHAVDRYLAAGYSTRDAQHELDGSIPGAHTPVGSALANLTAAAARPPVTASPNRRPRPADRGPACPNNPLLPRGRCGCCEPVDDPAPAAEHREPALA